MDDLADSILDSLPEHVAVLDREGRIIAVNRAWLAFAEANGGSPQELSVGCSYPGACQVPDDDDEGARAALQGILAVSRGEVRKFELEYPCHSPEQQRWFLMTVVPLRGTQGGAVVTHLDISQRKIAEQALLDAYEKIRGLKEQIEQENVYLRHEIGLKHDYQGFVGKSAAFERVLRLVEQVAPLEATVLVTGETGTGKELVARAIHEHSQRAGRTMVKVNCAALPSTLIDAELFGREKGAYTGALSRQIGRFELADGSSLFLDEIGELSLELQAKLLRVLQEGQFERLGSSETRSVDVRIIAATNRDLEAMIDQGKFREDLYYRLNVFPIEVPPLRERREDIPALVWSFVKELGESMGKSIERIPASDMAALSRAPWAGNIRELRNLVERSLILCEGTTLRLEPKRYLSGAAGAVLTLDEVQRRHILDVLGRTDWRIRGPSGAAQQLGMKPTTLEARIKKLGLARPQKKHPE